jgi:large subunit ribosomal protein L33
MSQLHIVKIKSQASGHIRYTRRNKKSTQEKLELKKYDPNTRKHEIYKEIKK